MRKDKALIWTGSLALSVFLIFPALARAGLEKPSEPPMVSGGFEGYRRARMMPPDVKRTPSAEPQAPITPGASFDAYDFDDNATENGGHIFIPPDPMGAAGLDRVIAVVNTGIEARTKAGAILFRDSLHDFFVPAAGNLGTFCYDPKIVYDQYENRFVVVALEQWDVGAGDPSDESRILMAVSKTSAPTTPTAADWWYFVIDAKTTIGAGATWADYPGLEVDEEAVYLTANMFAFSTSAGSFGQRLWIVHKGVVGGFYGGGATTVTIHDPYTATGVGAFATTTMPAHVFGAGGVGPGIGTYLISYNGLTYGGPGALEALLLIRVDNPLGAVSFTQEFVDISDIEDVGGAFGFPALPDAPQSGSAALIEVNDRRLLDAVWRNGSIWVCTTINPNVAFDAANAGQTTAHWVELDASAVVNSGSPAGLVVLRQEGNAGGEDIAPGTYTFFPALAVNNLGQMKVGFSASAPSIFASAAVAGRIPAEPLGFVGPSAVTRAGVDYYLRTFGGPQNRWGDYSGISVDPSDGQTFWVFNEWADTRGTPTGTEDGRWGTHWTSCTFGQPNLRVVVFDGPCCTFHGDVIGDDIVCRIGNGGTVDIVNPFAVGFYISADPVITVADDQLVSGQVIIPGLAAGTDVLVPLSALAQTPASAPTGDVYLGVIVDELNNIPESDETDNTAARDINVGTQPFHCAKGMASTAASPRRVSVLTVPDGSGRALTNALAWDGIVGDAPVATDATIRLLVTDCDGNPIPDLDARLFTSLGGLVVCPGDSKADALTDAAGGAVFTKPLYGGGYTDPANGEVTRITGATGPFAQILYGNQEMYASDQTGQIDRLNLASGAGAPVCNIGGPYSTEIEYNPLSGRGFAQATNGNFFGRELDLRNCAALGPDVPNGFSFNGLEWIGDRLWAAGIPGSCGTSQLMILDPSTGATVPLGPTWNAPLSGLAWDPCCRRLYAVTGCYSTYGPADLLRLNPHTNSWELVGNTQLQLGSLEFGPPNCTLYAGGGQVDGGNLWILDTDTGAATFVGPTGMPAVTGLALLSDTGLDIQFNSPDINGDLVVNLVDLGTFSADYVSGPYNYRSDYYWDGIINLVDLGPFASAIGAVCPAVIPAKPAAPVVAQGEIGVYFDAAASQRTLTAEPGADVTAYVMVTGKAASAGITAYDLKLETSSNVVVKEWTLDEHAINLREAPEFIVGLGGEKKAPSGQPLVLATARLQVTDREPAHLFLRASDTPSVDGHPSVALGVENGQLAALDVAALSGSGAAAAINDDAATQETGTAVFAGVHLRNEPNPFNPATEIRFSLPRKGTTEVHIYDVSGRRVRTLGQKVLEAGPHSIRWNGTDQRGVSVVSGVYFYQLFLEGEALGQPEKMTLLK